MAASVLTQAAQEMAVAEIQEEAQEEVVAVVAVVLAAVQEEGTAMVREEELVKTQLMTGALVPAQPVVAQRSVPTQQELEQAKKLLGFPHHLHGHQLHRHKSSHQRRRTAQVAQGQRAATAAQDRRWSPPTTQEQGRTPSNQMGRW